MPHSDSPVRASGPPAADLRHPIPDLQSLQGAYITNIERLEEHAERMSLSGSDIGEEIRKLQLEQKLSESRKSSLRSIPIDEHRAAATSTSRSRNHSTSSYANSIVDVNSTARWGGYSPGGFVTSPVGSLRSASFSQPASHRQRSGSRVSRLDQVVHAEDDYEDFYGHDEQAQSSKPPNSCPMDHSPQSRHSASSFSQAYDEIVHDLQQHGFHDNGPYSQDPIDPHDLPDRPLTAASTDTYQQARTLFTDFDGVHCSPTIQEGTKHSQGSHNSTRMGPPTMPPQGHPLPGENMVFYPAPVPKMLNLPKRLSQLPSANVQARRRTQLLDTMAVENRKSAAFLAANTPDILESPGKKAMDPRKSRMSLAGIPPQLRASAFFDLPVPVPHLGVRGESAAETLDNILDASAHAPVSAFTDHPFAGNVGPEVYGKEDYRKSTANLSHDKDGKKRRSTMNLISTTRNSSGDPLNKLKKRNSSQDLNKVMLRESTSRMSLSGEFEGQPDVADTDQERVGDRASTIRPIEGQPGEKLEGDAEEEYEEVQIDEPAEPQYFGAPTTLLAELQLRKQQQKSRNKTAATAFPNGMHATLLELDAVAELEKKKRHNAKVTLAWEAPDEHQAEDDDPDEDVPLGVLFPSRGGLANKAAINATADWDRPLGLIAQRELEDHEPLSKRRTRLIGGDPNRLRDLSPGKRRTQSQLNLTLPTITPAPPDEHEDEGETLAQRIRRLKNRDALDSALGDVRKSTVSSEFASELLGQLGAQPEGETPKSGQAPQEEEEETLGQRRARLQAEALAHGDNALDGRPGLKTSHSLADLLSAHPLGETNAARSVSNERLLKGLPRDSLLAKNEIRQSRLRSGLWDQNRMSSYGSLDKPLLNLGQNSPKPPQSQGGLLQQNDLRQSRLRSDMHDQTKRISSYGVLDKPLGTAGSSPSMMFHPNIMNPMPVSQDSFMMGMGMSMGMGMASMPNLHYPQMAGGMRQSSSTGTMPVIGMGMGMGMGMGIPQEPPMDPSQRDMIDRWRQGVTP
ncbi:hypothetical protein GQ43DRAFT_418021 [Delitschia confertaspora ATCC 74209]|uniref:Uncharacterized protein n=1 Tax=Delitschia confertaspora ATCC 74209 TaxID=1513339 RepID=A0A9P4JJ57_9PLEO|nr:hypothetical protein GQ43DRAFT_418021 [Delitschia confertaspora ATCC 74209]